MDYYGLRVTLNGFRLFGPDDIGSHWTVSKFDGGWNGAGTTHAHSAKIWGDGWFANRSSRVGRQYTLEGRIRAASYEDYMRSRGLMLNAIPMVSGDLVSELDGVSRLYSVRQDEGEVLFSYAGPNAWDYSIPLVSLSPYSFDAGDPLSGSTGLPSTTGGMSFPVHFEPDSTWVFSETTVSGAVNLVNPGEAPSPVTLRIDGPVVDPMVTHVQSGGILQLALNLGAGHYVQLDSGSRQVLVDGRDPQRGIVVRRGWSDALPGANTWQFTAKEYSKSARLTVSFRGAYL